MKFNVLFIFGIIFLFLGLLWMFLPHAVHDKLIEEVGKNESSHFTHTLEGAVVAALGAVLLIVEERKANKI